MPIAMLPRSDLPPDEREHPSEILATDEVAGTRTAGARAPSTVALREG